MALRRVASYTQDAEKKLLEMFNREKNRHRIFFVVKHVSERLAEILMFQSI